MVVSRHFGIVPQLAAIGLCALSANTVAAPSTQASPAVAVAPAPSGEPLSPDFTVTVNGQPVPVYQCRVSAVPLNQVWPGYQRPIDQTELASFACWDMAGAVQVQVAANKDFKEVAIRPASYGITPTVAGRRVSFSLPRPAHCTVELDGSHHALHLFASPPEQNLPKRDDPNVRYFGPGIHRPGKIELTNGQTVYVAAGAVVHGHIVATNAQNIRIHGRGILDTSTFERGGFHGIVALVRCRNVLLEGLILRDPTSWTVIPADSENVTINNLKLIGLWRYNSDGIDVVNSRDVTITNCFVRSFDDSIIIKGLKSYDQRPVQNVAVSGCVIWNDWGKALAIGPEVCAPHITDVFFRDCDIIRTATHAMDITCGDRAKIRNVCFEAIRMEVDAEPLRPRLQSRRDERYERDLKDGFCPSLLTARVARTDYSKDKELGSIDGIHARNITVLGPCMPGVNIGKSPAPHTVGGVTIEELRHNGRLVRDDKRRPDN